MEQSAHLKKPPLRSLCISSGSSLKTVLAAFETNHLGILFVVDEQNHLIGSVSDGDIRRAILKGKTLGLSVRIVMNPNPQSITELQSKNVGWLTKFIRQAMYRCIPIVDEKETIIDYVLLDEVLRKRPQQIQNKKKNSVLVVGGAGYIGSVLVRKLLSKGHTVRVLDAFLYGDASLSDLSRKKNFECIRGDSRTVATVVKSLKHVETVVHLGEIVGDPATSLDEDYTVSVNFTATIQLAALAAVAGVSRFIYTSSCSVYGFGDDIFDETSTPNPVSLYGRTKKSCEDVILPMQSSSFHPTVLRLATVFGWSYRPRFDLAVNAMCLEAYRNKTVTVHGGSQWRPFVHVGDVADAIIAVMDAPIQKVSGEIINVGSERLNLTISQVADQVTDAFPGTVVSGNRAQTDPRSYRVNFSKLYRILKQQSTATLSDGIHEMRDRLLKGHVDERVLSTSSNIAALYPG